MPHLHLRELKERATHTAQLQTPSKIYSQHVDAPMYLACIAHLISPLTRQHSNTACKHQSDYCTRACERRPPPVHTTTPSRPSPLACTSSMHLPSSVLRAACFPNSRRRCLINARLASKRIAVLGRGLHSPLFLNPGLEIVGDHSMDPLTACLLSPDLLSSKTDRNSNSDVVR
jgi:hypothetical protein